MSDERLAQVGRIPERVGGVGDRYTCRIQGRESYLWFEKGRWFVEFSEVLKAQDALAETVTVAV